MDEMEFASYLQRLGKKAHVIQGLVVKVKIFEQYLVEKKNSTLEQASSQDILDFASTLHEQQRKIILRGIALYYKSKGNLAIARIANEKREMEIAKDRQVLQLKEIRGINPEVIAKLSSLGIKNTEQMLQVGKTSSDRDVLAKQTGIAVETILELVKLSDLARIPGVKGIRARLYYDAGFETLEKLAQCDPDELRQLLIAFVERTGFKGIAPLPKEISYTIETAKSLSQVVSYQ